MPRTVAAFVHSLIQPAVDSWFVRQCHDPALRMYVYYKPTNTLVPGEFRIAPEPPGTEWKTVATEAIRTDFTREMAQRWIYSLSGSLPILPTELDLTA